MTKNLIIYLVATAVFITVIGMFITNRFSFLPAQPAKNVEKGATVVINDKEISIEVSKTKEERAKGLSDRTSLDENSGMLFIFEEGTGSPVFWMKGMLMPIDIVWIDQDKIIRIDGSVPAPEANTPDDKLKTYSAGKSVDYVLEVNAGFCDTNSIKVGDSVTISGV